MRRKRILLLTQWFEPEPTFKGLVFAKELIKQGYDVEVVTGFPNYPGGKLYPGYRMSLIQREVVEGVQVTRLPLYPSHDASAVRRIANYASFAASAFFYCVFAAPRADVVYVYQLPTLAVVAAAIRALRGSPFVFDVQDIWPDTLRATGMMGSERLLAVVDGAVGWAYRRAARVVVLSNGFRQLLMGRGVPAEKVVVIHNWCDERALSTPDDGKFAGLGTGEKFRLVFAGNMGLLQALDSILDAAALLAIRAPTISIVVIGGGVDAGRLKAEASRRGLSNVEFVPRVEMNRIGQYLRAADALLIHLKNDPLFSITIPGKTQAYMAMGKPVLIAAPGDAAAMVRAAECGVEAVPENAASIAAAAVALASMSRVALADMGRRGQAYYRTHLALSVGVEKFSAVFEGVS